jgi:excisionase family DNA binding protein
MVSSEYLTPQEAASELRVSLTTIYSLLRDDKLRAVRVGAQYRINRRDLLVQTAPEPMGFVAYTQRAVNAQRDRRP